MAPTHKKRLLLLCGASLLLFSSQTCRSTSLIRGRPANAQAQESCFTAGTMILMADGSQRAIETIASATCRRAARPGQPRRARASGRCSVRRRLYALNGGRPFVTAEHPFLTAEGWKALDPEATRRRMPRLTVASLQLGDQFCRGALRVSAASALGAKARVLFMQRTTTLEALAATGRRAETPLFNLLLDGDHSYVADGWIVHNKDGADSGGGAGLWMSDGSGTADHAPAPTSRWPRSPAAYSGARAADSAAAPPVKGPSRSPQRSSACGQPERPACNRRAAPLTPGAGAGLISRGWRPRD